MLHLHLGPVAFRATLLVSRMDMPYNDSYSQIKAKKKSMLIIHKMPILHVRYTTVTVIHTSTSGYTCVYCNAIFKCNFIQSRKSGMDW